MPIAVAAMFHAIVAQDLATQSADVRREPATIDTETSAALNVFGAVNYSGFARRSRFEAGAGSATGSSLYDASRSMSHRPAGPGGSLLR